MIKKSAAAIVPALPALRLREYAAPAALALSVGAALAVMAALYLHAWPVADDFQRAVEARRYGVFGGAFAEYAQWTCRWSAALLMTALAAMVELTRGYGAILIAIFAAVLLLVHSFLATALGLEFRSFKAAMVTLVFAALWWASSPDVAELFFWRAGQIEYQLGFAAALALCAFAARRDFSARRSRAPFLAALALGALLATGLHELAALLQAGLLIFLAAFARLQRGSWRPAGLTALAATLAGLVILFLAPGNAVRDQVYAAGRHLLPELIQASAEAVKYILLWLADARLIAASLALLALIRAGILAPLWPRRAPVWLRYVLPALLLAALLALYAVPYVALAGGIPRRALGAIHFVFFCGWLAMLLAWSPALLPRLGAWMTPRLAFAALALVLPLSLNVMRGAADLAGPAQSFHAFMLERDAALRSLAENGAREAAMPVIPAGAYPRSYVFNADLRAEPDFWINRAVASYYGLESVRSR